MSSANGKKIWALLAAGVLGSMATAASAAPFLTVSILGRNATTDPAGAFTSSVVVSNPGDVINYQLVFKLGVEGANNLNAGGANTQTITNWIPSIASGLHDIHFNLQQESTAGTVQANFTAASTLESEWTLGPAKTGGTVAPRGNGFNNLNDVIPARDNNNFAGVAADESLPQTLMATGSFTIGQTGNSSSVNPNVNGYANAVLLGGMRWKQANGTTSVNFTPTALNQSNSVAAGDPIVVFQGLALVPEPASLGLLGLAAVGAMARRRRA